MGIRAYRYVFKNHRMIHKDQYHEIQMKTKKLNREKNLRRIRAKRAMRTGLSTLFSYIQKDTERHCAYKQGKEL